MTFSYICSRHTSRAIKSPAISNIRDVNTNAANIETNWLEIKSELGAHLSSNPRFMPGIKKQRVKYHGLWKTMPLMTWGVEFHKNICNFPVTTEVLKKIPGLVSDSFNLLEKIQKLNNILVKQMQV